VILALPGNVLHALGCVPLSLSQVSPQPFPNQEHEGTGNKDHLHAAGMPRCAVAEYPRNRNLGRRSPLFPR